eukprot:sb/3476507/
MHILMNIKEHILADTMLITKGKICNKLIPSPIGPNGSLESPKKITKNPRWLSWVFGPRPFSCIFSDMLKYLVNNWGLLSNCLGRHNNCLGYHRSCLFINFKSFCGRETPHYEYIMQ